MKVPAAATDVTVAWSVRPSVHLFVCHTVHAAKTVRQNKILTGTLAWPQAKPYGTGTVRGRFGGRNILF